jgi:hypothetical protein
MGHLQTVEKANKLQIKMQYAVGNTEICAYMGTKQ